MQEKQLSIKYIFTCLVVLKRTVCLNIEVSKIKEFMPSLSSWGGGQLGCWGELHPGQW